MWTPQGALQAYELVCNFQAWFARHFVWFFSVWRFCHSDEKKFHTSDKNHAFGSQMEKSHKMCGKQCLNVAHISAPINSTRDKKHIYGVVVQTASAICSCSWLLNENVFSYFNIYVNVSYLYHVSLFSPLDNWNTTMTRVSGFEQFCLSRDSGKKIALIPGSRDFPGNFIFLIKPPEFNI